MGTLRVSETSLMLCSKCSASSLNDGSEKRCGNQERKTHAKEQDVEEQDDHWHC